MRFTKMEGLGNDFVVVDASVRVDPALVRRLTDRRRGVGADGLLQVSLDNGAVRMGYWNADGSLAEMCGNGLRCVARFAVDQGLATGNAFEILTPVGARRVQLSSEPRVELGPFEVGESFEFEGWVFHRVAVGNPHAVALVEDLPAAPVAALGSELGRLTPGGINVEFVRVVDPHRIEMRVWERGIGETLACGSGMVAAAAAAHRLGFTEANLTVGVLGGDGIVELEDSTSWLTGPVSYVFTGELADVGAFRESESR
jgi:diaminopimelate epimerase